MAAKSKSGVGKTEIKDRNLVTEPKSGYEFERAHRNLEAWKAGIELAVDMSRATASFPKHEIYGLAAQLRRAATSVPSNIAEGAGRTSKRELHQFLSIASGSTSEIDTQLTIALRLGYLEESDPIFTVFHRASYLLMAYKKSVAKNL